MQLALRHSLAAVFGIGSLLTGCSSSTEAKAKKSAVTIAAGTTVVARTNSTLSTQANPSGDTFTATLVQPLMAGNEVVAPAGAQVEGRVSHADPGGRVKGRAAIALQLTAIHGQGDRVIPVQTNSVWRSAPGTKKRDALTIGIISGAGAAIGAIADGGRGAAIGAGAGAGAGTGTVLATRGKPAVIPAESMLTFRLQDQVVLND